MRIFLLAAVSAAAISGAASAADKPMYGTWGVDLTARDLAVKPGDDFNKFANGGWEKRTTIPADEWPMDMATSPVRVTLEHGGTAFVVQPGQADRGSGIRTYDFHKLLAAPSQPLDVVARRSVGLHELP